MIESKSSIPMISSCYAIAFFASFHSVPMPYTLTWSIFRRFSLRLLYTYRILKAAFHFFVCAGVGESKKVSLPDSLIVICARLDGILSRVVVTSADFSAR